MNAVLTRFGYRGRDPETLAKWLVENEVTLVDIRFEAETRVLRWRGSALLELLGEEHYRHLRELGCTGREGPDPILHDQEEGLDKLRALIRDESPVCLLCSCEFVPNDHWCHAYGIADLVEAELLEVDLDEPVPGHWMETEK